MTYREIYFSLIKENNEYLNRTAVKEILLDVSGYQDFISLLNHFDEQIQNEDRLNLLVDKVRNGYPLQYALGHTFFINSSYKVSSDVLIPRPETEELAFSSKTMIEKYFLNKDKINIADIGTGSGILAIYLKENFKNSDVFAVDISEKALDIAKTNAKEHNVKINFVCDNMVDYFINNNIRLDVLISNPPYIEDVNTIDKNVFDYEPHLALLASPSTKFYKEIISKIPVIMNSKFIVSFEIGENMQDELSSIVEEYLPGTKYLFNKDMYNKTRFLYIIGNEDNKA